MKVTVEVRNDCSSDWIPDRALCKKWINAAIATAGYDQDCSISLKFVEKQGAAALNYQYRGKNVATNVLSFASAFPADLNSQIKIYSLGDVVICPEILKSEAQQQDKDLQAHWAHILIHGVLHLLGHDHQKKNEASRMERLEISALETLGIPNPYLIG